MKLIIPETVSDAVLTATNVAETLSAHAAGTSYAVADRVRRDSNHHAYEALAAQASASFTVTIANPGVIMHTAHGLAADTAVMLATTGALPTGLAAGTTYYVRNPTTDNYELAEVAGGNSINTTGSQSGTHSVNRSLDDPAQWLDLGPTNRWGMFDSEYGTITTNADTIEVTIVPDGRLTGLALFNLNAASVQVTMTDAIDGVVFDESFSLVDNSNVANIYDYLFAPLIRKTKLKVEDLPPYVGADIDVVIDNTGGTAQCGNLVPGYVRETGTTIYGSGVGFISASRKEETGYGGITITPRGTRASATLEVVVNERMVDEVYRLIKEREALPTVFIGTGNYESTLIYGFVRNMQLPLASNQTTLTLDIESLI